MDNSSTAQAEWKYAALSERQKGLWFHYRLFPDASAYNVPLLLRIRGSMRAEFLQRACEFLVDRHPQLRAVVEEVDGIPRQRRIEPTATIFSFQDELSEWQPALAYLEEKAREPFDLARVAPLRIVLLSMSAEEHLLLLVFHHMVIDGASEHLAIQTIFAAYEDLLAGRRVAVAAAAADYRDFVEWESRMLASEQGRQHRAYWLEQLAGASGDLPLPVDRAAATSQFPDIRVCGGQIDATLSGRLRALCGSAGVGAAACFLTVFKLLLHRYTNETDLTVMMPTLGRPDSVYDGTIGYFSNMIPVRTRIDAEADFAELVRAVQGTILDGIYHADYPFARVVRDLNLPLRGVQAPLFQVAYSYHGAALFPWRATAEHIREFGRVTLLPNLYHTGESDLMLEISEQNDVFAIRWKYDGRRFDPDTIARAMTHYVTLLDAAIDSPSTPVAMLPVLPPEQLESVLWKWNATAMEYPREMLVHELFAGQAARSPQAVAVAHEERELTYRQLDEQSNQLSRYLIEQGVKPDTRVALCMERGVDMIVAVLGILKAGGACVPLDPHYPSDRLQYMLRDAVPSIVITRRREYSLLGMFAGTIIALDDVRSEIDMRCVADATAVVGAMAPGNLAYVIYTSGSTGQPKGTMMPHLALVNLIQWQRKEFPGRHSQRTLQFAALGFDVAFQEIFTTLCTGGALVMIHEETRRDFRALGEFISANAIQRMFLPFSALECLAEAMVDAGIALPALEDVVTAGEQLRITPAIAELFGRLTSSRLHNHYGPTETHVATSLTLPPEVAQWPALPAVGRPIANTRVYVLDQHRQPVPVGVVGEIYIAGAGVARGYLNRPELTAERFSADPFGGDGAGRMYRTGDLGRWSPHGTIEFVGRNDEQVKIRGYRIEPGEIESHLSRHAQVKEAVVVPREEHGLKRLVAYYTVRGEAEPGVEELRDHLHASLPEYMVPAVFVRLERVPLTANGKIDKRALPVPDANAPRAGQYEAPRGEVEKALARIWEQALKVEQVGRHDNFFELGGHSLSAVQIISSARRAGLPAEASMLFNAPTIAAIASALGAADLPLRSIAPPNRIPPGCKAITPQMLTLLQLDQESIQLIAGTVPGGAANIQDIYPLTPLQEGMLFHYVMQDEWDTYIVSTVTEFESREQLDRALAAWQTMIDRHDALRTAFVWQNLASPVQVVYRQAVLPVQELAIDPDIDALQQLREWSDPRRHRMDLQRAPLLRAAIAPHPHSRRWLLAMLIHHSAEDLGTVEILADEIHACVADRQHELAEPVPFRNFVAHLQDLRLKAEGDRFFRGMLADVCDSTVLFGLDDIHVKRSELYQSHIVLQATLVERVRRVARTLGVNSAVLFHVAWGLVVARCAGRDDVVFGTVQSGRLTGVDGIERMVGMFINTLPLRMHFEHRSVRDVVLQVDRALAGLAEHGYMALTRIKELSGLPPTAALFTTVFNYRRTRHGRREMSAVSSGVLAHNERTNYPIGIAVDECGEQIVLSAQTDPSIEPARIVSYLETGLSSLVGALESRQQAPVADLTILADTERRQVIEKFNRTRSRHDGSRLLHELVEAQAAQTPTASALTYADQQLSYEELNRSANRLAWHLLAQGVRPDMRIAICMERSMEVIVALLAVLKAGGAYVPLDPSYPAARLEYMLGDSKPAAILLHGRTRAICEELTAVLPRVDLDADGCSWAQQRSDNPQAREIGLTARHLAYVIYTSGSTGQPKGVMIEHRAARNLVHAQTADFAVSAHSRVLQFASFSFDACVSEVFTTLCSGARLCIADREQLLPGPALGQVLRDKAITHVTLPPVALDVLPREEFRQLSTLIVAGEACPSALARAWAEGRRFINAYGPTETAVCASMYRCEGEPGEHLPIGHPISNTQIYLLDRYGEPVPIGVSGEIHIGGAGVARGYLNRAHLTAQRFVADPFSGEVGGRMYRTGDMGRWRADGNIEFLGREDHQVKIRGYRIELGEIESRLLSHGQVKQAVVMAREDAPGDKRLVAYVAAPREELKGMQAEAALPEQLVNEWQSLYDTTYEFKDAEAGPSFAGWNSSYTGLPIPRAQMQEWLDCTIARIQELRPRRVLEIGCGSGLLLQALAPDCEVYRATDFSSAALAEVRRWSAGREQLKHVELLRRMATDFSGIAAGSVDTVILNSVVQYFPDAEYLWRVLRQAVATVGENGRIFIGDVRNLNLLEAFHASVQVANAELQVTAAQLRSRTQRAMEQDKELVIAPEFFAGLAGELAGVSEVEIQLKAGRSDNELTRYRYDVVLHVGRPPLKAVPVREYRCEGGEFINDLSAELAQRTPAGVRILGVANRRLARDLRVLDVLKHAEDSMSAQRLRAMIDESDVRGEDPETFRELAQRHGYEVKIGWSAGSQQGCFDVELMDPARKTPVAPLREASKQHVSWHGLVSDPLLARLRGEVVAQLRASLKAALPEYMMPSSFVVLESLPTTANGKVDRKALPAPEGDEYRRSSYESPQGEVERALTQIWEEVLKLERVGRHDNFFELGGHSLLAVQVVSRIFQTFGLELPAQALFQSSTVEQLGRHIDTCRRTLLDVQPAGTNDDDLDSLVDQLTKMSEAEVAFLLKRAKAGRP